MVALSNLDKDRTRFHLGYGAVGEGTPAGDVARLENAMNNILSDHLMRRVKEQLDRCDRTFEETETDRQDSGIDYRELITGDINRTVVRYKAERLRVRMENYNTETDRLADLLRVPNYNNPSSASWRFYVSDGAYIRSIPGPADTSIACRIELWKHYV
jgi:hypothetical protein